jgi:hypothetical protein
MDSISMTISMTIRGNATLLALLCFFALIESTPLLVKVR